MGYGSYSHEAHRAITSKRTSMPREAVFKQKKCHPLMDPLGLKVRESRDSDTHPRSLGIVFALDVTGSMGHIPEQLAKTSLPTFMKALVDQGVDDPQVLFLAVGDATCDRAPLQVGQFESEAELMDQWLTWTFLEGGGGGGNQESYELAMYVAARHTQMDCFEKRGKRGWFFMTGDENPYPQVSSAQVGALIGAEVDKDVALARVVEELRQTYHPFDLIPDTRRAGRCERAWRDALGDHVIVLEDPADTVLAAASIVGIGEGKLAGVDAAAERLLAEGSTREQVGRVVRAITPWAATLGDVAEVPLHRVAPGSLGASGHVRVGE